jgi:Phage integrase family
VFWADVTVAVLPAMVREANRARRKRGAPPISEEITPHTLRRTFISLQLAHGRDVSFVQRRAGHRDPRLTLRVYTEVKDTDFGPMADILELLMAYSGEDERPAARRRRARPRVQRKVNAASAASRFLERAAAPPTTGSLRREIGATEGRLRSDLQSPKGADA